LDGELELPAELDLKRLPKVVTAAQAAQLHRRFLGPATASDISQNWEELTWRRLGGRKIVSTAEFVSAAERRLDAAPVFRPARRATEKSAA
jgi:hypothetical protein